MTPAERTLRARIGAYSLHSQRDSREITAPARQAFLNRFNTAVDPQGILPAAERQRRAEAARKAYFSKLALKSAQTRRKKQAKKKPPIKAAAEEKPSLELSDGYEKE